MLDHLFIFLYPSTAGSLSRFACNGAEVGEPSPPRGRRSRVYTTCSIALDGSDHAEWDVKPDTTDGLSLDITVEAWVLCEGCWTHIVCMRQGQAILV